MPDSKRVLFIFLDGVGIGPPDVEANPFLTAKLPNMEEVLCRGVPTLDQLPDLSQQGFPPTQDVVALPLDPLMGMEGLPQSGTGQTALLTGENAAELYGRHFGPWVPVPLRPLMARENILSRAQALGVSCCFANAYPRQFVHRAWTKRPAGPPLAAHAAGLLTRNEDDLARGEALSSEMVNTAWRTRLGFLQVPEVSPEEAGRKLGRIATQARLTLFAHYATDTAGHERSLEPARAALERVDAFLGGLVPTLSPETLLVLASDHGNIEDITQGHTRNPTLGIIKGPGAGKLAVGLSSIMDVPGMLLRYLTGQS